MELNEREYFWLPLLLQGRIIINQSRRLGQISSLLHLTAFHNLFQMTRSFWASSSPSTNFLIPESSTGSLIPYLLKIRSYWDFCFKQKYLNSSSSLLAPILGWERRSIRWVWGRISAISAFRKNRGWIRTDLSLLGNRRGFVPSGISVGIIYIMKYFQYCSSFLGGLHGQSLTLFEGLLQGTLHVECSFGVVVSLALKKSREALDGVLQLDEFTLAAGEDLTHEERLGQEFLDLTCSGHGQLIVLRQLVHTQDGNDILKGLVVLEQLLDTSGNCVVLLTDYSGVQNTGGRVERIDGGVNTQFSQGSGQHSCGVQEGEGGGWGGIGQIVSWHVNGLHGGNGAFLGGCDSLLKGTQVSSQCRLITDG